MRVQRALTVFLLCLGMLWASAAGAALPIPAAQFDSTGFIEKAELDTTNIVCQAVGRNNEPRLRGGWITVNGLRMTVPCNTILQMPASSMTWADLFDATKSAPVNEPVTPITAGQTGLALADLPKVFPSFEVRVVGNILTDPTTGAKSYIVGLIVPVTQQGLNVGTGIVSAIDRVTGFFRVGGKVPDANCATVTTANCSGMLVKINDPIGRFGPAHSPDPRFSADTDNPTIRTVTGYPMCIGATLFGDSCNPVTQRPLNGDPGYPSDPFLAVGAPLRTFDIPLAQGVATTFPNVQKMMPLMVGDSVDFSGTLVKVNPALGSQAPVNTYVSAHTVIADLGIYTPAHTAPSYVGVDVILLGTLGNATAAIAQERTEKIRVEGFITDASLVPNDNTGATVDIFAVDVNPCTGVATERYLATPFPGDQAAKGRWRWQQNGPVLTATAKLIPSALTYEPPTREMMIRYTPTHSLAGGPEGNSVDFPLTNGLIANRYKLPNFDFIFPEHIVLGAPQVPANFEDLPFLAMGSGPLDGVGVVVGQLRPWPGDVAPIAPICVAGKGFKPILTALPATLTAAVGAPVVLQVSVNQDPNGGALTFTWTQTGGLAVSNFAPAGTTATFTAPNAVAPNNILTFTVTAKDSIGTSNVVTITVAVVPAAAANGVSILVPAKWLGGTTGGAKGGKANIAAFAFGPTSAGATLTVTEVVEPTLVDPLAGTTVALGAMAPAQCIPLITGVSCLVEVGVLQPASYTVTSSTGGQQTVVCAPDPKKPGSLSCL